MILAIDLDHVLVDLHVVEKASGQSFTQKDVVSWGYSEFPAAVQLRIWQLLRDTSFMMEYCFPKAGIQDKLDSLNRAGHVTAIVTSRFPEVQDETRSFVRTYIPQIGGNVFFSNGVDKLDILKSIKADYYIDDNPACMAEAFYHGISCVLVSNEETKYNHEFRNKDYVHSVISNFNELVVE